MITKFQKFEVRTIHRRKLKNAPYNPRVIDDYAMTALKGNIRKNGLLEPLVWNETTGNLVSGHQRIKILDSLNKGDDYEMSVSVVKLSKKEEMEQNIFFNSKSTQGEFDAVLLKNMITQQDLDLKMAGLDEADLAFYGINIVDDSKVREAMADEFTPEEKTPFTKEQIQEAKKSIRDKGRVEAGEAGTYVSLSFKSLESKRKFLKYFGYVQDELFIMGEKVSNALGIEGEHEKE